MPPPSVCWDCRRSAMSASSCFICCAIRVFPNGCNMKITAQTLNMDAPGAREINLALQLIPLPRAQKMLVARDITEIARVEAMRRDFVANVSHELRTPITVIVGFLEAFEDMPEADPAQFRKHIPLMREQSDRIRRLVDDLLTLARLESEPETKDETVDVVSLVERLAREAETMSQGKHRIELNLNNRARLIGNSQETLQCFGKPGVQRGALHPCPVAAS
jgi:two-component system phosphate regulon sensor histidine kinase PhoR